MIDEGPSSEDLDRFGDDVAHCPECGAEVWDLAEFCPSCDAHIGGDTLRKSPVEHGLQRRWMAALAIILAILISGVMAFLAIIR